MHEVCLNGTEGRGLPLEKIRAGVAEVLGQASAEGIPVEGGELSITFVDDAGARDLNLRYLGHDWVPDVLSFALHAEGEPPVGDVYIGFEQALRQASDEGVPAEEEFVRLAVHGVLHVLGQEHPEGEARMESEMYRRQEAIVSRVMETSENP